MGDEADDWLTGSLRRDEDDDEGEEPEHFIDFTYDGAVRRGPSIRAQRKELVELRTCLDECLAGGDNQPVFAKIESISAKVDQVIEGCNQMASQDPEKRDFFLANAKGYLDAVEALERMQTAVEEGNDAAARRSMAEFEAAVDEVDALLKEAAPQ